MGRKPPTLQGRSGNTQHNICKTPCMLLGLPGDMIRGGGFPFLSIWGPVRVYAFVGRLLSVCLSLLGSFCSLHHSHLIGRDSEMFTPQLALLLFRGRNHNSGGQKPEKSCVVQCICKRYPSCPWCLTRLGPGGGGWRVERRDR